MKIKLPLLIAALILTAAAAVVGSVAAGTLRLTPAETVLGLLGLGPDEHVLLIRKLRLPRILVALLAGASLAAAGAILQSMIRNPLASPDVIGVTEGASAAAVALITFGVGAGVVSIRWLPVAAMAGAAAVGLLLYLLSWRGGVTAFRLVLVGLGLSAIFSALTTLLLLFNPNNEASQAYVWLTGSVYGSNWADVRTILPWTAALIPLALMQARAADVVLLGDETAAGVGVRVQLHRFAMLATAVGLTGSAVAVAGGLAFVGLIAPHMARKLTGPVFTRLLPVSALLGAIIVVLADLVGRTLFMPMDIPAGVWTAAVGAPFFLYLLFVKRNTFR